MLRRRLRHCKVNCVSLFLFIALTAVTLTLFRNHNKAHFFNKRNLELVEENQDHVNCTKIIKGDFEEIQTAKLELLSVNYKKRHSWLTEQDFINMTKDCNSFTRNRKYILYPLSQEESEFPIAYSIVVHKKN